MSRTRRLLSLLAGLYCLALLGLSPAQADVDCADLTTRSAAASYYAAHPADADRLDADGDGRACEHNVPTNHTDLSLLGLGALVGAALLGSWLVEKRRPRLPARGAPVAPAPPLASPFAAAGHKRELVSAAHAGSLGELAHALRRVPYAERLELLESHAATHGAAPQEVLDALAGDAGDLELQRWALVGYGPPSHVRSMHCSCVGGLRNFRLGLTSEGVRSWSCVTCHVPARLTSRG